MPNKYIYEMTWGLFIAPSLLLLIGCLEHGAGTTVSIYWKTILFILISTLSINYLYRRLKNFGASIFFSFALLIICGLGSGVMQAFYWVIIAYFAFIEFNFLKEYSTKEVILRILLFSICLLLLLIPYFSFEYYSQPINEVNVFKGNLHVDTFYHLAIASMIKNYGVVSHGLHGLGALEYHFGSHALIAALSRYWQISTLTTYGFFYPFFVIPLLGLSILAVSEELSPSKSIIEVLKKLSIYLFIFLGLGLLVKDGFFERYALWTSFYESESYAISLIFLLSLISVLLYEYFNSLLKGILILLLLSFMAATKISTGFLGLATIGFWALASSGGGITFRNKDRIAIFLICAFCAFEIFQLVNPTMSDAHIEPFQFIRAYVQTPLPITIKSILFISIHFAFPIFTLAIYYGCKHIRELIPLWLIFSIAFSTLIGLLVILLLYIQGGSGYYFSNVSMFLALPILLMMYIAINHKSRRINLIIFGILISIAILGGYKLEVRSFHSLVNQFSADPVKESEFAQYIDKLKAISADRSTLDALVYIPRSEDKFWRGIDCRATGYLIAAISERPALYAWPSPSCYNFLCGNRFHSNGLCEKSQHLYLDDELIAEAKSLGFARVIIIEGDITRVLN